MSKDIADIIHKHLDKVFEEIDKDWKERVEPFIEETRRSIKHPHFYYAEVDTQKLTVEYKRKKWYQWFSGKRIVHIKLQLLECASLPEYYKPLNDTIYFWDLKDDKENEDDYLKEKI